VLTPGQASPSRRAFGSIKPTIGPVSPSAERTLDDSTSPDL
jgi:hypothetical protein